MIVTIWALKLRLEPNTEPTPIHHNNVLEEVRTQNTPNLAQIRGWRHIYLFPSHYFCFSITLYFDPLLCFFPFPLPPYMCRRVALQVVVFYCFEFLPFLVSMFFVMCWLVLLFCCPLFLGLCYSCWSACTKPKHPPHIDKISENKQHMRLSR